MKTASARKHASLSFRYSLRTLLLSTAVVAVACAWIAARLQQVKREREAVRTLEEYGAMCGPEPGLFRRVDSVNFACAVYHLTEVSRKMDMLIEPPSKKGRPTVKFGDDELAHLALFPGLKFLNLQDTQVTDRGLERLTNFDRLDYLRVARTKVTREGVIRLRTALPRCEIDTQAK
jgi:hypothetical protein